MATAQTFVDFRTVHAFFMRVLESVLGHPAPVPEAVTQVCNGSEEGSDPILSHWLNLLDLGITPPMMRESLSTGPGRETAASLLRYYVRKRSCQEADRDKTDLVATWLYRLAAPSGTPSGGESGADQPSEFEAKIGAALRLQDEGALAEEHCNLLREFPFIRQEVDEFRHFDELMDAGVIQRVRDIKGRFGTSFYHPRVLAAAAEYNVFFGRRFDDLFQNAAQQIREFATALQEQGASIMTRVEDKITIRELANLKERDLLQAEYGRSQEAFRRVSTFRKAVNRRSRAASPEPPVTSAGSGSRTKLPPLDRMVNPAIEEAHLRNAGEQIRNFILAADPKASCMVPLRNANVGLSVAEIEAFRTDFENEKSFRAVYAGALRRIVSLQARISAEMHEFESRLHSEYLWKPHAVSLVWLLHLAGSTQDNCEGVLKIAQERGLAEKASFLNASLQKLQQQVQFAARLLERAEERMVSRSTAATPIASANA